MEYQVYANNVFAGSISEEDYNAIREAELKSGTNHIAQAANIAYMAVSIFSGLLRVLPMIAFYGLIVLFIWWPEEFRQLSAAFQADPSMVLRRFAEHVLPPVFMVLVGFAGVFFTESLSVFGFKNRFARAINTKIRRKLGIQTIGEITVLCYQEGGKQRNSRLHLLGLPAPLFVGYVTIVWLTFGLIVRDNLPTTVIWATVWSAIAYGYLHYLYRNGKVDRLLNWTDKQCRRWEERQQAKRGR